MFSYFLKGSQVYSENIIATYIYSFLYTFFISLINWYSPEENIQTSEFKEDVIITVGAKIPAGNIILFLAAVLT